MGLTKKQTTALATLLAVSIGGGITALFNTQGSKTATPANKPSTTTNTPSVSATVTKVIDNDVFEARAHTWVGQYVFTTICTATPKPPCTEQATVPPGEKIAEGSTVHLANIKTLASDNDMENIAMPSTRPRQDRLPGPVPATVTKLIDGDTVEVTAKIWPRQRVVTDIRMGGIDTPEKDSRAKCDQEAALAEKASAETKKLLEGQNVMLYDVQYEKYGGRVLGTIKTNDGTDAAQNLVSKGLARAYSGKTKESWCRIKK